MMISVFLHEFTADLMYSWLNLSYPQPLHWGEYSVIYFPIFSRSMRSFGVQSW